MTGIDKVKKTLSHNQIPYWKVFRESVAKNPKNNNHNMHAVQQFHSELWEND